MVRLCDGLYNQQEAASVCRGWGKSAVVVKVEGGKKPERQLPSFGSRDRLSALMTRAPRLAKLRDARLGVMWRHLDFTSDSSFVHSDQVNAGSYYFFSIQFSPDTAIFLKWDNPHFQPYEMRVYKAQLQIGVLTRSMQIHAISAMSFPPDILLSSGNRYLARSFLT